MSNPAPDVGSAHAANRAELLDAIRAAGRISRIDLGRERGLNGATVSTVVRSLIKDGLVVESGKAESTGGKPKVLLSIVPNARFAVGINLDHAGISYVIANLGGAVVGRWRRLARCRGGSSRSGRHTDGGRAGHLGGPGRYRP